jgi:exo-poly-alpha-galacturonosidase
MTIANVTGTTTYLTEIKTVKSVAYKPIITVGTDKEYQSINDALAAVRCMTRENTDTVKIMIDPGNYEEMLVIDIPNVILVNASTTPSIALLNKGVDIDANAVRITSYYGHGYNYFSMGTDQKWNADILRVNKENGYTTYSNTGSGTTNGSYWNATVVVSASGFRADNIIFENSFNQYISKKESEDVVQEWSTGGKGTRPTTYGSTDVQNKSFVERAAAIAFTASADRAILNKCRVVGRQDSFYGAEGARIAVYKGVLMGATDYLFGGMTLTCYQTDLAMNTSEASSDVAYITAAQQNSARGFLMYECNITSAVPSVETASLYRSKPGYFGRPWQPTTSEVVFYSTTIETTNNPSFYGQSLIVPAGWNNSLGGTSDKVYEYNTIEKSGVDNSASRVSWSKVLTEPVLSDGTEITTFNFTKGTDNWDPINTLKSNDINASVSLQKKDDFIRIFSDGSKVFISNVKKPSKIKIYSVNGSLSFVKEISGDDEISLDKGLWIVNVVNNEGIKTAKVLIK